MAYLHHGASLPRQGGARSLSNVHQNPQRGVAFQGGKPLVRASLDGMPPRGTDEMHEARQTWVGLFLDQGDYSATQSKPVLGRGCPIGGMDGMVTARSGRVVAVVAGRAARLAWLPAVFWLRSIRTRPEAVHRFTMSVFVHSPQSQKNLLGEDLMANAPLSGRNRSSDCDSSSSSPSVPSRR
jgi:hypothetical protein